MYTDCEYACPLILNQLLQYFSRNLLLISISSYYEHFFCVPLSAISLKSPKALAFDPSTRGPSTTKETAVTFPVYEKQERTAE